MRRALPPGMVPGMVPGQEEAQQPHGSGPYL
jgi:hypothetical protein